MKIAIATEGSMVSGHFGHCDEFTIYDLGGDKVVSKDSIENPGHKPGFLPVFLSDKGINIIVSGGMGEKAIDLFNDKGIDVITGASGDLDAIVARYIKGDLLSDGSSCNKHEHSHECGNH